MQYDKDNVDEMSLALLCLVTIGDKCGARAWKTFDWDTIADREHDLDFLRAACI
jgi:hypothetical protein